MGRRYFKPRTLSARSGSDRVIFCITRSYLSCVRNVPSGKITKASEPKSFARRLTPSTSCSLFFDPRSNEGESKRSDFKTCRGITFPEYFPIKIVGINASKKLLCCAAMMNGPLPKVTVFGKLTFVRRKISAPPKIEATQRY